VDAHPATVRAADDEAAAALAGWDLAAG
jgi:hypothetical protein